MHVIVRKSNLLALGLALLFSAPCALATLILVDFNDEAAAPSTSNGAPAVWNSLASASAQGLVDSTGAASGVTISFAGVWTVNSTVVNQWQGGDSTWLDADAAQDYFWGTNNNNPAEAFATITFSGLNDSLDYYVELVASRAPSAVNNNERFMPVRVNGAYTNVDVDSSTFNSVLDGYTNSSILRWSAVSPVSGAITLTITDPVGASSYFVNAAMVTTIPEPQSLLLTGLAALALLASRGIRRARVPR